MFQVSAEVGPWLQVRQALCIFFGYGISIICSIELLFGWDYQSVQLRVALQWSKVGPKSINSWPRVKSCPKVGPKLVQSQTKVGENSASSAQSQCKVSLKSSPTQCHLQSRSKARKTQVKGSLRSAQSEHTRVVQIQSQVRQKCGPKSSKSWPKLKGNLKTAKTQPKVGPTSVQSRPKVNRTAVETRSIVGKTQPPKLVRSRFKVNPNQFNVSPKLSQSVSKDSQSHRQTLRAALSPKSLQNRTPRFHTPWDK